MSFGHTLRLKVYRLLEETYRERTSFLLNQRLTQKIVCRSGPPVDLQSDGKSIDCSLIVFPSQSNSPQIERSWKVRWLSGHRRSKTFFCRFVFFTYKVDHSQFEPGGVIALIQL